MVKLSCWGVGLFLLASSLGGCGKFFPPLDKSSSSSSSSSSTSTSGDYLYVANAASSLKNIAAFTLSSSGLSVINSSGYSVASTPTSIAITPSNSFAYVGSGLGGIYLYSIGSTGALTASNDGEAIVSGVAPLALCVDSTGKWLLGVDALTGYAYVYAINSSTGALTAVSGSTVQLNSTTVQGAVLSPDNNYLYVALGSGGIETLSFNDSTGALAQANGIVSPLSNLNSDLSIAVSPNGEHLFVGETGTNGVRVFAISSGGVITEIKGSPFETGLAPKAILVDSTGSYVYVANRTDGTISAFSLASDGKLTAISGSPFAAGSSPVALAEDNTDKYIAVVDSGGSPDLKIYSFSSTTPGALVAFTTTATGTDPADAVAIAASH